MDRIISVLIKRITKKTIIKNNITNKEILFFNIRNFLINLCLYVNLNKIANFLDIAETTIVNIFYEDSKIKFRTILTGNITTLKQKILEIKNHNIDYFIQIPDLIINGNNIVIKNIFFIDSNNNKIDVKKLLSEYIEYDCPIKIMNIINNNIIKLKIEYYLNFKLSEKIVNINDILDLSICDINTVLN